MSMFQEIGLINLKGIHINLILENKKAVLYHIFVVQQLGDAVHAYPLGDTGKIKPYNQPLVDAIEYYEKRLKSLQ